MGPGYNKEVIFPSALSVLFAPGCRCFFPFDRLVGDFSRSPLPISPARCMREAAFAGDLQISSVWRGERSGWTFRMRRSRRSAGRAFSRAPLSLRSYAAPISAALSNARTSLNL